MFQFCYYFYQYIRLINSVRNYINVYNITGKHNDILLDYIIHRIVTCGSVAIKLCQWITPKLELMYIEERKLSMQMFKEKRIICRSYYINHNHNYDYPYDHPLHIDRTKI